jgi:hypothetical protein
MLYVNFANNYSRNSYEEFALAYPEGGFGGFKPHPEIIPKF